MKNQLLKFSLLIALIMGGIVAEAHTTQIWTVNESDGSITFYARTYHRVTSHHLRGGIILTTSSGSSTHRFTRFTRGVPSGANLILNCRSNYGSYYQVVNVKKCGVKASVTTTRTSAVEAPWCSRRGYVKFGNNVSVTASTDASPVYYGYSPLSCANLSSSASGGSGSYSYSWSSGDNTSDATVCPTASTTYTVTATDGNGCSGSASVDVAVVDVRCGKKLDKVAMCKSPGKSGKTVEICVAAAAVPAQLKGGASLGSCPLGKVAFEENTDGMDLKAYPNPFTNDVNVTFRALQNEHVRVEAFDVMGRSLGILFNEDVESGVYYNGNTEAVNYPIGLVILHVTSGETTKVIKMYHKKS